jgi:hypothetical protein
MKGVEDNRSAPSTFQKNKETRKKNTLEEAAETTERVESLPIYNHYNHIHAIID